MQADVQVLGTQSVADFLGTDEHVVSLLETFQKAEVEGSVVKGQFVVGASLEILVEDFAGFLKAVLPGHGVCLLQKCLCVVRLDGQCVFGTVQSLGKLFAL